MGWREDTSGWWLVLDLWPYQEGKAWYITAQPQQTHTHSPPASTSASCIGGYQPVELSVTFLPPTTCNSFISGFSPSLRLSLTWSVAVVGVFVAAAAAAAAMPGAYKGECGDNVDPMPFLVPSEKERLDAMNKPYDIKRSCWIKDEKEAFIAGEIQSEDGDKVTVKTTKNTVSVKDLYWAAAVEELSHSDFSLSSDGDPEEGWHSADEPP